MIREDLQNSFKQRTDLNTYRKQQELEEDLYRKTLENLQQVDIDAQRVRYMKNVFNLLIDLIVSLK